MSRPVYALIINYNGYENTIECLESVYRSDYPALTVLVLDNDSSDGSMERIRAWYDVQCREGRAIPTEILALGQNRGFAGGNNAGLRQVLERDPEAYAWLLNNDAIVAPDALRRMVELAETNPAIGAVGATLLKYAEPDRLETAGGGTFSEWHGMTRTIRSDASRTDPRPAIERLDFVSGTCMLVPGRTVSRVGFMDERYFLYGEDIDWGTRIRESGLRLAYCAEAEVWHKGGGSTVHKSALHDYYNVKSSLLVVHKRNPALLPIALAYSAARCVVPKVLRGEWARLRAVGRGYLDFARQISGSANASRPVTL